MYLIYKAGYLTNLPDLPELELYDDLNGQVQEAITVNSECGQATSA